MNFLIDKYLKRNLRHFAVLFCLCLLPACNSTGSYSSFKPLAPPPPTQTAMADNGQAELVFAKADQSLMSAEVANNIEPAAFDGIENNVNHNVKSNAVPSGCRTKDRFDRKDVLAFEYGDNDRKRLAFDVDGIGVDQLDIEQVRVSFTYRLQPIRGKKQRCRYRSSFQGMVGSGYNEFIRREGADTVWHEIRDLRYDVEDRLGF